MYCDSCIIVILFVSGVLYWDIVNKPRYLGNVELEPNRRGEVR